MKTPAACDTMAEIRAEIDRVDRELVALLVRRAACIDRAVLASRVGGVHTRAHEEAEVSPVEGR